MPPVQRPLRYHQVRRGIAIENLSDAAFRKNFRMSKAVFQRLVQAVEPEMRASGRLQRQRTPLAEAVLMGLWVAFNPDTFRSEGVSFDKSTSVIHSHYKKLMHTLCDIGHRYIKWPSAIERQRTALFYERNFGIPGVVSSIDGTLVKITAPSHQKQRYVDRHHKYSLNVQIAADHRLLIRNIYAGQPGSVNDARVFKRSSLGKNLYRRNDMLSPDQHLIGDGAYTNTTKLLTPYQDFGNLTPSHRNFNRVLSGCRSTVERVNGLWKSRFGRLRRLFCKDIVTSVRHIVGCGVLYNFILLDGHEIDGMDMDGDPPNVNVQAAMDALAEEGAEKRRFIRILLDPSDDEDDDD